MRFASEPSERNRTTGGERQVPPSDRGAILAAGVYVRTRKAVQRVGAGLHKPHTRCLPMWQCLELAWRRSVAAHPAPPASYCTCSTPHSMWVHPAKPIRAYSSSSLGTSAAWCGPNPHSASARAPESSGRPLKAGPQESRGSGVRALCQHNVRHYAGLSSVPMRDLLEGYVSVSPLAKPESGLRGSMVG